MIVAACGATKFILAAYCLFVLLWCMYFSNKEAFPWWAGIMDPLEYFTRAPKYKVSYRMPRENVHSTTVYSATKMARLVRQVTNCKHEVLHKYIILRLQRICVSYIEPRVCDSFWDRVSWHTRPNNMRRIRIVEVSKLYIFLTIISKTNKQYM